MGSECRPVQDVDVLRKRLHAIVRHIENRANEELRQ